jgi:hypothetical protein
VTLRKGKEEKEEKSDPWYLDLCYLRCDPSKPFSNKKSLQVMKV